MLTSLALFSIKSGNKLANKLLALFLLVLAFFIIDLVIMDSGYYKTFPHLYGLSGVVDFLLPIPLYFYIKALTNPDFRLSRKNLYHLIPFFLILLLEAPNLFLNFDEKVAAITAELIAEPDTFFFVAMGLVHIYVLSYFIASFRLIKQTSKKDLPEKTINRIKWLKVLLIVLVVIATISTILDFIPSLIEIDDFLTPFFLTIFIYGMGFMGIRQSELFTADRLFEKPDKYKKSTLSDELVDKTMKKLDVLMNEEKIYREGNISLPILAKKIHLTTHQLSQILNERLDKNFFNYISEQRINEAKETLLNKSSKNITMLELSLDIGFNSLSAFNTAFKKHTGMSPTEFRKQHSA